MFTIVKAVKNLLTQLYSRKMLKYFFVACLVVSIELIAFHLIYLAGDNYIIATVLSFGLAVILNWIIGRVAVFGASSHHPAREFAMVSFASIAGLGIQLGVVLVSVEVLLLYPLIGKILSIMFSFFWNYWFRVKIIYA